MRSGDIFIAGSKLLHLGSRGFSRSSYAYDYDYSSYTLSITTVVNPSAAGSGPDIYTFAGYPLRCLAS